ncbi:hypothetical protein GOV03_03505 [Candidatus Woesearchaeota archaeon]|nr:hypothetical protein [Candidatus Woesearchaeota archaeon]
MSPLKPFKIEIVVRDKIEDAKRLFNKVRRIGKVNLVLLGLSSVSFILFYSAIKDVVFEFSELLLNLDWYWYLIVAVVLGIKPAIVLMRKK